MTRVAVAAFASGLGGALLGAMFGAWAVRDEAAANLPPAPPGACAEPAQSAPQNGAQPGARSSEAALVEPASLADDVGSAPALRDPAAVSLPGASEAARAARTAPGEAPRSGDRYWASELTMRLGLSPAQSERLRGIQDELQSELARAGGEGRAAVRRALQKSAEAQLRALLAPRQLAAYEDLEDRLKLYPPGSGG